MKHYEIVSLGSFCLPRVILTKAGLKPSKVHGELSLPFDLAEHEEYFVTKMIESNFKNYFENLNYNEEHKVWLNGNFIAKYNHDDCFGKEDILLLIKRYKSRITNFWNLIETNLPILFIQAIEHDKQDVVKLFSVLKKIRKHRPFELVVIDISNIVDYSGSDINILKIPYPNQEYIWWEQECYKTSEGVAFENIIVKFCKNIIIQKLDCELNIMDTETLRLF